MVQIQVDRKYSPLHYHPQVGIAGLHFRDVIAEIHLQAKTAGLNFQASL